ncbi:hypothetical protein J7E50_10840 [Pedobacter sp. ISL-68]|uniref:hypothetical protein n=1 Tax=unclassified Pedobacter TaxID=2628915 RepID=UPI001BE9B466|nr:MULTISPECIES: hypothetical protein [unclassified Pedobacter]MBT2561328.1 hypothetical protein [Pedobacter sp. ISL-64]MBT2590717.1 hypothetical protein [Pedobacter sp. ISL-68]
MEFKTGSRYTIIKISEWLATTEKDEIIISGFLPSRQQYYFKHKRSKKEWLLPKEDLKWLVFEGHNLPLRLDSETNRYMGNACINFVSDNPEELRGYIEKHCINTDRSLFSKIYITPEKDRETIINPPYDQLFKDEDND